MGLIRSLFTGSPDPVLSKALSPSLMSPQGPDYSPVQAQFAGVDVDSHLLYGSAAASAVYTPPIEPRIARQAAMSVPAVKKARDLICGGIGQIPLRLYSPTGEEVPWTLLKQPEDGIAGSVTWERVVEDLLLHGVAWLRVTFVGWHNKPVAVVRLDPTTVTVQQESRIYYSATGEGMVNEWPQDSQLIRIDSPNDPLLVAGARAIRSLLRLEEAAANAADGIPPLEYFTPKDGTEPLSEDKTQTFLNMWKVNRRKRSTAYVSGGLEYHSNTGFNPDQLQMAEARQFAITEVARLTGVDAEELSVSTTSRTYSNQLDRRRAFVDFVLAPYMKAISDRLSMEDVTPRGFRVAYDLSDFLTRSDPLAAAQVAEINLRSGAWSLEEARAYLGMPQGAPEQPTAQPAELPAKEEANV